MKFKEYLQYGAFVISFGKDIIKLVQEAEELFEELKPGLKSGKEKLDYVKNEIKYAIEEIIDISNELWNKIEKFVEKKIKRIVKLFNDFGKFKHTVDKK